MSSQSDSVQPVTEPTRKIRVLWLDPVVGRWSDVVAVLRHPVTPLLFAGLVAMVFFANRTPEAQQVSVLWRLALYAASPLVAFGLVLGWMALRFGRRPPRDGVIDLTLPVLLGVVLVVPPNQYVQVFYIGDEVFSWLKLALRIMFYSVIGLAMTVVLVVFLAPRLVARRMQADLDRQSTVVLAGKPVVTHDLVKLEAQRNRVLLTLRSGQDTLPGPLADRIAELPTDLGRLVHRSVWIREGAVTGHRRDGRDIVIDLDGGHRTVAAASRHSDLLPWLQSLAQARDGGDEAVVSRA